MQVRKCRVYFPMIESDVFYRCSSLTSIEVDENNSNYSSTNGILFNKEKTRLILYPDGKKNTEYTVPSSVTSIGDSAFRECRSLSSIEIPEGVTSIGAYAFCECTSLSSIEIPSSVTSIGSDAFRGANLIMCVATGTENVQ